MKKIHFILSAFICAILLAGCQKYLQEKPDVKLAVPSTLTDFQALLDYYPNINNFDPGAGEISADDYYLADADYNALALDTYRRIYSWQKDNLFVAQSNDWFYAARPVFTANTVLENLDKVAVTPVNQSDFNNVKGQAYFIRARAFEMIARIWALAYDPQTATTDLGIPLTLSSDFNLPSVRSNVQQTYAQIIADAKASIALLPVTPIHVMRPARPAAYALLAETYLSMRDYLNAGLYADSCLQLKNSLLDYNTLSTTAAYPFAQFNTEVIRESKIPVPPPLNNSIARIDPALYASYAANDLRKVLFFKALTGGAYSFRGSYEASANIFSGLATDEVYLIRAECRARAGNIIDALADLNTLLIKRWKTGTFVPLIASDAPSALTLILTERRKELLMRGLRWIDLKRLNKEGEGITPLRIISAQTYTLLPNTLHYALPIPEDIIMLSGMPQNPQ